MIRDNNSKSSLATFVGKKGSFTTVISVDPQQSLIHFANMTSGSPKTFTSESVTYKSRLFDEEFFGLFSKALESYLSKHPAAQNAATYLIVPDTSVTTDIISIPTMKKDKFDEQIEIILKDTYKNRSNLKVNKAIAVQNKQYTTFAVTMMNQKILNSLYGACATHKMTPKLVTFGANASACAFAALNPRLKSNTYLLLNLKVDSAVFSLVNKGRTAGYFDLPFGYGILAKKKMAAEDLLFDNPEAELLILNAIEKAKAKQVTMVQEDGSAAVNAAQEMDEAQKSEEAEEETEENETEEETEESSESTLSTSSLTLNAGIKVLPKKTARKLPKFMTRNVPEGEKEITYENFRIFVKWALNIIQSNKSVFTEEVKTVYVNMPQEFDYLFDVTNVEKDENGVEFAPACSGDTPEEVIENFELYGGFFDVPANNPNEF